jgi:hypothetical protein
VDEEDQTRPGLSEDYLALVHQAFAAYEASGDAFERARLVSAMGKTHAPRLLEEVERLRDENARLRAALRPLVGLATDAGSPAALTTFSDEALARALRMALELLDEG